MKSSEFAHVVDIFDCDGSDDPMCGEGGIVCLIEGVFIGFGDGYNDGYDDLDIEGRCVGLEDG